MIAGSDPFSGIRREGGFSLIMADPPWLFRSRSAKGGGRSAQAHYGCMSLPDIAALPVASLAAKDCLLWLWATNPMLPHAFDVLQCWGFQFKTAGHWAKTTKHGRQAFGTGYVLRCAGEPFLVGTRGAPRTTRTVRSVVMGRVREHSRKPDEAFAAAEQLMPEATRLELFSREPRAGWATWGNESDKFAQTDQEKMPAIAGDGAARGRDDQNPVKFAHLSERTARAC